MEIKIMTKTLLAAASILMISLGSYALAEDVKDSAAQKPAATESKEQDVATSDQQASEILDIDPDALKILQELELAGSKHKKLQASIEYIFIDKLVDDKEIRTGTLSYDKLTADSPSRFRLSFVYLIKGRKKTKIKDQVDYCFDGQWLTIVKHRTKEMISIQITADKSAGVMKLGKGPLPLPIGQKVADVAKVFDVSLEKPEPTKKRPATIDPDNTDYIRLVTKLDQRKNVNMLELEVWVCQKTSLPLKVISYAGSRPTRINKVKTYILSEIKTESLEFDPSFFRPVAKPGWNIEVKRLKPKAVNP